MIEMSFFGEVSLWTKEKGSNIYIFLLAPKSNVKCFFFLQSYNTQKKNINMIN